MEKFIQLGKEFGLEGAELLAFVEKQQELKRLEEDKEEERRQLEEGKEEKGSLPKVPLDKMPLIDKPSKRVAIFQTGSLSMF